MKTFIIYFKFKTDVIIDSIDGSFEVKANDQKEAKDLANRILDCFKVKVENVKIADKGTGFFLD
jgi:hypothetical protein